MFSANTFVPQPVVRAAASRNSPMNDARLLSRKILLTDPPLIAIA
jgi:hypothetical protein